MQVQVHEVGTKVVIDRVKGTIGMQYPKDAAPRETYSLNEDWIRKYATCRVCSKELDDTQLAYAFNRHEQGVCGSECRTTEIRKRHACCDKAVATNCVCAYSFTCPVHGDTHIGTHD